MTTWASAHALAHSAARPLPPVTVPLAAATGLITAAGAPARVPSPSFDAAAMDGYAVAGPGPWRVVAAPMLAGSTRPHSLRPGEAIEIATGAVIPEATAAVVPYELCTRAHDLVTAATPPPDHARRPDSRTAADRNRTRENGSFTAGDNPPRDHIRRVGDDFRPGDLILPAGRPITAVAAAALAQAGVTELLVHPRPAVVCLITGDEVVMRGTPGPGQVLDAFSGIVAALATPGRHVATAPGAPTAPGVAPRHGADDTEAHATPGMTSPHGADDAGAHATPGATSRHGADDTEAHATPGVAPRHGADDTEAHATPGVTSPHGADDAGAHATPGATSRHGADDTEAHATPGVASRHGADDAEAHAAPGVASRHVADDAGALAAAIAEARAEVVVVTGASSRGAADHLHGVLDGLGAQWLVDGVECRPGHPQGLAALPDGRWVVSLPGNPYAGLVAALTLLEPLLARLAGRPAAAVDERPVDGQARPYPGGVRVVPVVLDGPRAVVVPGARPGGLRAAAGADALAVLEADWEPGSTGRVLRLP
ncbi:molybdopterin-binding protein [Dactylosporangium sp. CS-033363]|uniref:molybdopterin-binding protein n=1 Tax=Dactylosporangium sp. CS-033363 TaxID=3239935 RepID=UPI003D94EF7C